MEPNIHRQTEMGLADAFESRITNSAYKGPVLEKETFEVALLRWSEVHLSPGAWGTNALRATLDMADFEDEVDVADIEDMTLMALQDLGVREASDIVLRVVFGNGMSDGVRQNLISELEEDRPWERFAEISKQHGIFDAITLLHKAFPTRVGTPDAVSLTVQVTPRHAEALRWIAPDVDPAMVVRLLAGGMPEDAVVKRLYGDELRGMQFPSARALIWQYGAATDGDGAVLDILSSHHWLDSLQDAEPWRCVAWADDR